MTKIDEETKTNESKESKPRLRSASGSTLPLASVIPDTDTMKKAVKLMNAAVEVAVRISELKEKDEEIRAKLCDICELFELKGFKHGMAGFEYHGMTTRQTLSKEKLLAAGVSAETIANAYSESKPFAVCRVIAFDLK